MSCSMASIARCLMSAGAEKSGKPCERFTAPYFSASRVISRITDSVNKLAFFDICLLFERLGVVIRKQFNHRLRGLLRNDLFAGRFAFQLFEDGANGGCIAAVRRELKILFVRSDGFLRLFHLFISGADHLVDDWLTV